ncbi:Uncharacterised protein [Bordetella pertussis]|nr:Uncharacterised protein [Bordetella pertussis]
MALSGGTEFRCWPVFSSLPTAQASEPQVRQLGANRQCAEASAP